MKNQTLFSSKDKSKKLKCYLLQFLFGGVMVNELSCVCIVPIPLMTCIHFRLCMSFLSCYRFCNSRILILHQGCLGLLINCVIIFIKAMKDRHKWL